MLWVPCEPAQHVWEPLVGCCNSCRGGGFLIILPCLNHDQQTQQPTHLYLRLNHSVLTVATVACQYHSFIKGESCSGRWCRLLSVLRTAQLGGTLGPWVPRDHFLGMSSIHPLILFLLTQAQVVVAAGFWGVPGLLLTSSSCWGTLRCPLVRLGYATPPASPGPK